MLCKECLKEVKEKIDLYLYYVSTNEGSQEFVDLDKTGKTDATIFAGTTRVFNYCFKDYME